MKKIVSVVAYFSFIQETFIIKHVQYIQLRFTERLLWYACPYTGYSKEESRNLKLTLSDAPANFPPQRHRLEGFFFIPLGDCFYLYNIPFLRVYGIYF